MDNMKGRIERETGADGVAGVVCPALLARRSPRGESAVVLEPHGRMVASAIDPGSCPVGKSGISFFSRILSVRAPFHFNQLPVNQFQLKQHGGFPGFPGNFPGVYRVGGVS